MSEQKPKLVMDIIRPAQAAPAPVKKKSLGERLLRLVDVLRARKKIWLGLPITLIAASLVTGLIFLLVSRNPGPLPSSVTKNAGFALYYPSPLPDGYTYKKGSAKLERGIVFYTLQSGSDTVTIGEQAVPTNPPQLSQLPGFTSLQTTAGNTAIGTTLGKPIAITVTNTTLISITGTKTTPSDVVTSVAKNMSSLPN